jgi:hypothetical protein
MKGWTSADIIKIQSKLKVSGAENLTVPEPAGKIFIEQTLDELEVEYTKEFPFVPGRKFRADYYVESLALLIEYEGIYNTEKSRHTSLSGYSKDTIKYNLAAIHGYKVLRYTASTFNDFSSDIKKLLDK